MDRFRAMQVFIDVIDTGSLAAAARKLQISRAMATRYIAFLERELNTTLLHRTNRSLGPTDSGRDILSYCRQMLDLADEMYALAADKTDDPAGALRINCSTSFARCYLSDAIDRFLQRHPRISVELSLTDQQCNLAEERIDVSFLIADLPDPKVIARRLAACPCVLCASPDYLDRHGHPVCPEDLLRHNCLDHYRFNGRWRFVSPQDGDKDDDAQLEIVQTSGNLRTNDTDILVTAALRGRGIAALPLYVVKDLLDVGLLVTVLPAFKPVELSVFALTPPRRYHPATSRALIDFVALEFGNRAAALYGRQRSRA